MKKAIYISICVLLLLSCSKQIIGQKKPAGKSTTITFSGYTWQTRETGNNTQGPGHNRWKGSNAFVDANGYLHLKLNKAGDNWYCAEITSTQSFGYGTYQWQVEGRTDTLDKNVVLGLFNYSGVDGNDEMDIELSRWGNSSNNNTSYTIYPTQPLSSKQNWNKTYNTILTDGENTTQRFKRNSDRSVFFQELGGFHDDDTNLIDSVTCYNPPHAISKLAMPVHMNLWLFESTTPSNNIPVEIIIRNFKFTAQ
jgi:hypothetical protein